MIEEVELETCVTSGAMAGQPSAKNVATDLTPDPPPRRHSPPPVDLLLPRVLPMAPTVPRAFTRAFSTTLRTLESGTTPAAPVDKLTSSEGPRIARGILSSPSLASTWSTRSVPPESPRFIEIEKAKTPHPAPRPYVKGTLPKPKNLFPSRTAPHKGTPEYIDAATPDPKSRPRPAHDAETRAFQKWKRDMAATRKAYLREGLSTLKERQEEKHEKMMTRLKERQAIRDEALNRAEREDVRLTLPSVLSALRLEQGELKDPNREKRFEKSVKTTLRKRELKKQERKDQVLELYTKAKDFILTEAQLDKAIQDAFMEDDNLTGNINRELRSARGLKVTEMLADRRRGSLGRDLVFQDVQKALTQRLMPAASPDAI